MRNLLVIVFLWCTAFSVFAQDIQIKGVVVSGGDNLPLPGVNVVVKGTSIGTITDLDGQFSFAVPAKSMLSITYIGYKPLEVAADGSKLMNITLQEIQKPLMRWL